MASTQVSHTLVDRIKTADYWLSLADQLHINDDQITGINQEMPTRQLTTEFADVLQRVQHEGYIDYSHVFPEMLVNRLRTAIARLQNTGCPPVFCAVYDEFWQLLPFCDGLLKTLLGPNYKQLPDFWVWFVDPQTEGAGWRPHRDKGFAAILPDGSPKCFTVWIPLTDVTPLNGCIYVVPSFLDPPTRYSSEPDNRMPANLQDVRALPATAGSLLGWNQAILHWGGRSSTRAEVPRMSIAFEFQRADVPPYNEPLLIPHEPPQFTQRLSLIGKQILQYKHMYGISDQMAELAERLITQS